MRITIQKVGKIQKADITVEGLTLIAGKNDTGKSSVSKTLYAIIKSINEYTEVFHSHKTYDIRVNYFLPLLQRYSAIMHKDNPLSREIILTLDVLRERPSWNAKKITEDKILSIVKSIKNTKYEELPALIIENIDTILKELEKIKNTKEEDKLIFGLNNKLRDIFSNNINNSKYHEPASVDVFNQGNKILSFEVADDKCFKASCDFLKIKSLYGKVIYIETPFVLERIFTFGEKPHWREILSACYNDSNEKPQMSANTEIIDFIQNEIFGQATFGLDKENVKYYYQVDKDSSKISLQNSACGIKSFALLFSLLKEDNITKDTLLLIDEPENHLHPEWQIKYAQLICLLIKKGFSVVINSHSPTFIQALGAFSNKYGISNKSSFYLAEQSKEANNYSKIEDVSNNVERIYENLIVPTEKLFTGV